VGGVAIPLLFRWEVHIHNLLVSSEVGKVSGSLACAGTSVVGSVESAREAIPPVVVSLDWMGLVVALSRNRGIVASAAPTATVTIVVVAPPVGLGGCSVAAAGL
jgi:hypothetical protein